MSERKLNGGSGPPGDAPPQLRCFVGARLERRSAQRLRDALRSLYPELGGRGARLVPLENLHVTLRFLGGVPLAEVPGLVEQVSALLPRPLVCEVSGFTGFPRPRHAQLGVAELVAHEQLHAWWARLRALPPVASVDARPFRPHVTLVRFRSRCDFPGRRPAAPLTLSLEAPQLFRSDQTPRGVSYRALGPKPAT